MSENTLYAVRQQTPLRTVGVAFGALWLTLSLHEISHLATYFAFQRSGLSAQYPGWTSLMPTVAGPAVTWALLLVASWFLLRRDEIDTDSTRFLWLTSIAAASAYRFVVLGLLCALLMAFTGRVGPRGDEYKIGNMTGVPFELLLFGDMFLALVCWAFIIRRYRGRFGIGRMTAVAVGLLLGIGSWMAVAYGVDVPMMK